MTNNASSNATEHVLITGASSGIGYALAKIFAQHHYALILTARNEEALLALQEKLKSDYDAKTHLFVKDLGIPRSAAELYQQIKSQGLEIHILVNDAGLGYAGEFSARRRQNQLRQPRKMAARLIAQLQKKLKR